MKNVIGLCGAAGAGKDTVALMLQGYRAIAFADSLYAEVAEAFGVTVEWLKRREFKEVAQDALAPMKCEDCDFRVWAFLYATSSWRGPWDTIPRSPRQILQWWGDYRRAQDPDYFVKRAAAAIEVLNAYHQGCKVVLTDVRFANEAALVREMGGDIWQVVRPGVAAGSTGHSSDVDGSQFAPDRVIVNDGTLEDLQKCVNQYL